MAFEKKPQNRFTGSTEKPVKKSVPKTGEKAPGRTYGKPSSHHQSAAPAFRKPGVGNRNQHPQREDVARMLAFKALQDVFRQDAYASLALNNRLRESGASVDDKRLATHIFYAAVENRLLISFILQQFVPRTPDNTLEDILHIAIAQLLFMDRLPDHSVVDEAVKMARRLDRGEQSGFVNGVLRSLLRAKEAGTIKYPNESMPAIRRLSLQYSCPEPLVLRLIKAYGEEETEKMLSFIPAAREESVRCNHMLMTDATFKDYLKKRHFTYEDGLLPGFARISGSGNIANDPDYLSGMLSIQGEGAALAALAVDAKPAMRILDACAAPGGKTCLLAEIMKGTGRVHAWDVHDFRVDLIRAAAKRIHLDNIRPAVHDSCEFKPDLENQMDAVLVDAPCSGFGVMINKPDVKYRYKDQDIESLVKLQSAILDTCSRYVKKGGVLVYSTCTILPEENCQQISAFLQEHSDFVICEDNSFLPEQLKPYWKDGMIQLQAHRDGTEGFFIAKLRRTV